MNKVLKIKRKFIIPILFFLFIIIFLLTIFFQYKKQALYNNIDKKLLHAVETIRFALADDFHDRAIDSLSISPEEDLINIKNLSFLSKQLNVSFLYTLIVRNGKIYFTSSSTNKFELQHKTTIRYFTEYFNTSVDLKRLVITNKPLLKTTSNQRGCFRTILKPYYSRNGNLYIAGADIDIQSIKNQLNNELLYMILIGISIILLFIPIIIQIIRIDNRLTVFMKRKIEERTGGLSKQLINHKQTSIQLEKAIKERDEFAAKAKEALDSKTEIINIISHELLTPLNVINGMSTLLFQTQLNNEQKEFCLAIQNAEKQIITLIEEMLQLYHIQPEKINLEPTTFELNDIFRQLMHYYKQIIHNKQININYSIDERIPRHLLGNESFIKQILFNLLNNAAKYTEKGSINIDAEFEKVSSQDNKIIILIKISDTGIGISEEQQMNISKALNNEDISNKSSVLGLGLTLCKHFAKMIGATIWLKSELGKGSTFFIRLPLSIGTTMKNSFNLSTISDDAKDEKLLKEQYNILLVEDNELNVKVALLSLEKFGHNISIAKNGKEAIAMLKNKLFDIILMNIEMPEMNGLETASYIRNHPEEVGHVGVPIIVLTAYTTPEILNKFKDHGIHNYMVKPVNFSDLNILMHQLINKNS